MQGLPPCIPGKREMNPLNKTIRIPFTISLALIFSYSMLSVVFPPRLTANDEVALTPKTELRTIAVDNPHESSDRSATSLRAADNSVH